MFHSDNEKSAHNGKIFKNNFLNDLEIESDNPVHRRMAMDH
jgi:hypothetical protein